LCYTSKNRKIKKGGGRKSDDLSVGNAEDTPQGLAGRRQKGRELGEGPLIWLKSTGVLQSGGVREARKKVIPNSQEHNKKLKKKGGKIFATARWGIDKCRARQGSLVVRSKAQAHGEAIKCV